MRLTIGEIASMAGVSKATVSRVINHKPDVDPLTRQRILGLIDEYGFQPNAFAKAISLQKSHSIGLLIPHEAEYVFSNPFYTEVMRGVSTEVDRRGYYLVICYAHEKNYLDIYHQKRVDGFVLLSPGSFHKAIIQSLDEGSVPFVSTAKIADQENMAFVDVDNTLGAILVVEHLVSLGHEKIAYISKPTLQSSQDRLAGYKIVMEKHNLPCCDRWMTTSETSSIQSGYNCTQKLLALDEIPTAIFLANDMMAIGAINAIQEKGLRVPEDVSVVGFDDVPQASYLTPPLTTVRQPTFSKGVYAAGALIDWLETSIKPSSHTLEVELIVRSSTAPPRIVP